MPLRKLTNLEKNQIDNEIKNLDRKKELFSKIIERKRFIT